MTIDARYPVTYAQRSMLLHHAAHPSDTAFDLGFVFRIDGDVDHDRLIAATRAVLSAATAFSTTFQHAADGLFAVPGTAAARVFEFDRTHVPAEDLNAVVVGETERLLASGPIAPDDPHQVTARFYRGADAFFLTFVASHLVSDAYSFYRVVGTISVVYASTHDEWPALLAGLTEHPGTVGTPPVLARSLERYRDLFASVPEPGALPPVDRERGKIEGLRSRVRLEGQDDRALRVSELAEEHGTTALLFAAYAQTLSRLVGSGSLTVGVPVAGRAGHRAKNAVGFFVNTLPLPLRIDRSTTWRDLCAQVASGIRILQGVQGLDVRGSAGAMNLAVPNTTIDNAVTLYAKDLALAVKGAVVTSLPLRRPDLPYPFTVTFADEGDAIRIEVAVSQGFERAEAAAHLAHAIERAVASPDGLVVDDAVFDDAAPVEGASSVSPESTVVDLILSLAATRPRSIALRSATDVTYEELADRMMWGAGELDQLGATRLVVVRMDKSADAVLAILSVLASGRAYVPLDPAAPRERAEIILGGIRRELGTEPTILVDGEGCGPGEVAAEVITRTTVRTRPARTPIIDERAYVIFTSGSTGEPKGVVIPHRALSALLHAAGSAIGSRAGDRWCLFHSLAFDFSVWELFGALTTGGTLVVPSADDIAQPDRFAELVEREGITVLNQTPSAFRRLTDALGRAARTLPDVRVAVFGGEALHPADLRTWRSAVNSGTRFVNMYGITETTVHVTAKTLSEAQIASEHRSVIGEPLAHLDIGIIDELGRSAPVGVAGEMVVAGAGLAEGYLGRDDLTTDRFRSMRVGGRPRRAYQTGDRVRRDPDGELVYLGRIDHQVQLRGYRIELGEIEAAIAATGRTRGSVVAVLSPQGREPFLCAWVVSTGDADIAALRAELSDRIPAYMLPAAVVALDSIPMTSNGKPDTAALPVPALEDAQEIDDSLAGRIARIWEETIGAGRVHPHDRFLEVGGTSMHVMEVHERLHAGLGLHELTLVDLFEHPTPAALADHVLAVRA